MTLNANLFKAILSMDSYNRGYGQGIEFSNVVFGTTKIGNTTIVNDSLQIPSTSASQSEGFYAIAYNYNGETIISYRGTDENVVTPWGTNGSDLLNGYGVGGGYPMGPQAYLAFQFYQAVAAAQGLTPLTANISLTGHSLGGGLAGLVGSIYGKAGTLFDNMGFEGAAQTAYFAASDPEGYATTPTGINSALYAQANVIKNFIYGSETPWATSVGSNQPI